MKLSDLIGYGKKGPHFLAFLKGRHGSTLLSTQAETREAAEAALVEQIRACFRGHYMPLCLQFRNDVILIWRDGNQWVYGHVHADSPHPSGVTIGGWTTRDEVEREARKHLSHLGWDGQEESSPIIAHPDDQEAFTTWARTEKRSLWLWRKLHDMGWNDDEARHIIGGFFHLLAPARLQQLGDPRPLLL